VNRKVQRNLPWCALCSLALIWAFASLWFPFGWDHGILASVGDVIVRGGMPYRDAWDMKGPLAFYGYALAQWLFGRNMWAIRFLDLSLLGTASFMLARMVGRIASPKTGLWAAVGLVLWYGSLTWFFVSQPDGWVALFVVVAVAPLATNSIERVVRKMAWAGLLIGCCALIKPFYGAFLLVPMVFAVSNRESVSRRSVALAIAGLTALLPVVLVLAWFAYRGALGSLIEVHVSYAAAYADSMRPDLIARRIFNYFWSNGVPTPAGAVAVILPAIGFGAYVLWRERRPLALVVLTWLAVALSCVALQGKFWFYHWVPTFPPFIVLGAVGLHKLATDHARVPAPAGSVLATMSLALFMVQVVAVPAVDVARWLLYASGVNTKTEYYSRFFRRNYVAANEIEAARYIREHSEDSDTVLVWGNDATIGFLSDRESPTRFVFSMPLTGEVSTPWLKAYRKEYIASLTLRRPRYVVIGQPHDGSSDKQKDLQDFFELRDFINENYRLDKRIGFLDLYCRVD
jgi:Glycosyltransferase family 87